MVNIVLVSKAMWYDVVYVWVLTEVFGVSVTTRVLALKIGTL